LKVKPAPGQIWYHAETDQVGLVSAFGQCIVVADCVLFFNLMSDKFRQGWIYIGEL